MQNVKCKMTRCMAWFVIAGAIVDRLLKSYAQGLPEGTAFSFFPGLEFGYVLNSGLFFFPAWRFIPWLALAVLITLFVFLIGHFIANWKFEIGNSRHRALLCVLLGGASNVFDRFAYGGVIDYVNIFGLATINLADILIFAGLLILILPVGRQVFQPYDQRR